VRVIAAEVGCFVGSVRGAVGGGHVGAARGGHRGKAQEQSGGYSLATRSASAPRLSTAADRPAPEPHGEEPPLAATQNRWSPDLAWRVG
jgi:hypothetical protein